jgi:hypothetical protein
MALLPIIDVNIYWNAILEYLEWAYRVWEFACEWLQNPKCSEYQPLFATQHKWTIVK